VARPGVESLVSLAALAALVRVQRLPARELPPVELGRLQPMRQNASVLPRGWDWPG